MALGCTLGRIEIKGLLRPCMVCGRKALFHCWSHKQKVYFMPDGHNGGPSGDELVTVAIIEYENGEVAEVMPQGVTFLDTPFQMEDFDGCYCRKECEHNDP